MPKIIPHFPDHKIWIEPFFGSGSAFFNKQKAKYNIVNDLDSDVFNLFQVVVNQKEELEKAFYIMPIHSDLLNYWKKNKETDPIKKALRFLLLSNFGYMGETDSLRFGCSNDKNVFYKYINKTVELLDNVQFNNSDFRKFLKCFPTRDKKDLLNTFIYCDPPYTNTRNNYSGSFTKSDSIDLFNCLEETGCKYAMSEFDNPFIIDQAKKRNLNIITIGERQNLKNKRTEILITNYSIKQLELF
jgi:DNA adenine methylase